LFRSSGRRFGLRNFFFNVGSASACVWGHLADVPLDLRKLPLLVCLEHAILGKRSEFLLDLPVLKPSEFVAECLEFTCGDGSRLGPVGLEDQQDGRLQVCASRSQIGPSRGDITGELRDLAAQFLLLREKLRLALFRCATGIVGLSPRVT
jgi:hypothetical protein